MRVRRGRTTSPPPPAVNSRAWIARDRSGVSVGYDPVEHVLALSHTSAASDGVATAAGACSLRASGTVTPGAARFTIAHPVEASATPSRAGSSAPYPPASIAPTTT